MPHPKSNMNAWFRNAFATATETVTHSVTVGRPIPLKKPSSDHRAMPSGPPSMRGNQYSSASPRVSWGMPKGEKIDEPDRQRMTNTGAVNRHAHKAVHTARDALAYRPAP